MTLVRPILEYASCVWDSCGSGLRSEIEMIQRRAARFVMNDYGRYSSVDDMLSKIGWKPLEIRRKESRLCLLYKMYNGEIREDVSGIICQPCYMGRSDHPKKIRRIQSRLLPYHQSFFPRTIRDWNNLPRGVMGARTLGEFKEMLLNN